MIPALEAECVQEARDRSVTLPADWSVKGLLDKLTEAMMDVQAAVLKTAAGLRRSGWPATQRYTQHSLKKQTYRGVGARGVERKQV